MDPDCSWDVERLVEHYYRIKPKLSGKEIFNILVFRHSKAVTQRGITEIVRRKGLSRKRNVSISLLDEMVRSECTSSLASCGYRQMTEIISLKYDVWVSKEDVRKSLLRVDPEGVAERRARTINRREYFAAGPFSTFHIDGNNKLKK